MKLILGKRREILKKTNLGNKYDGGFHLADAASAIATDETESSHARRAHFPMTACSVCHPFEVIGTHRTAIIHYRRSRVYRRKSEKTIRKGERTEPLCNYRVLMLMNRSGNLLGNRVRCIDGFRNTFIYLIFLFSIFGFLFYVALTPNNQDPKLRRLEKLYNPQTLSHMSSSSFYIKIFGIGKC